MVKKLYSNHIEAITESSNASPSLPKLFFNVIAEDISTAKRQDRWFDNTEGWYLESSECTSLAKATDFGCSSIAVDKVKVDARLYRGYSTLYYKSIESSLACFISEDFAKFFSNIKDSIIPELMFEALEEFFDGDFAQANAALEPSASYLTRSDAGSGTNGHDAVIVLNEAKSYTDALGAIAERLECCIKGKGIIWMNTHYLAYFKQELDFIDGNYWFNGNLVLAHCKIGNVEPYAYGGVAPVVPNDEFFIYATSPVTMLIGFSGDSVLEDFEVISDRNRATLDIPVFASMNYGCCKVASRVKVC